MNILILANNDIGLYKFRKELLEELLKNNKVYFCVPYGEHVEKIKSLGCKYIKTEMDRRGINPFVDLKLVLRYDKIVKKLKPDLVITYTIKPNIYGSFICRLNKISCAVNITGLGTAFDRGGVLKKIVVGMYKMACKKAKVIFFENSYNQKVFIDAGICEIKRTKVLNGAGVNLVDYSYQEYPKNDNVKFLFVGRVMKEKGVDELFTATKRLVEQGMKCSLDVVGPFEEDYKKKLEIYESEGWLNYYGYQDDVRPFIKQCDCFVLPSHHEGMANTNLESAASGRPIITSNIPGCCEAIIDGESGFLFEKYDARKLEDAMKKMIKLSCKEREKMGLIGREYMKKVFDKDKVVRETILGLGLRG